MACTCLPLTHLGNRKAHDFPVSAHFLCLVDVMLRLGQVLKGKITSYEIVRQLKDTTKVWCAKTLGDGNHVIVKFIDHWRIGREKENLQRFQDRTPHIRSLVDTIEPETYQIESKWPALILQYTDDDLLSVCQRRTLTRREIKFVAKSVLEAIQVLHLAGFVHTDIKPGNVLVNYESSESDVISEVQLADFESAVHEESIHAKRGDDIGTALFRSTEAAMSMHWKRPTDIWSYGTMVINMLYGGNSHIFRPGAISFGHEDYEYEILRRQHQFFGPWPKSYFEIANEEQLEALLHIMKNTPTEDLKPFKRITNRELSEVDKEFLMGIMKLDPRDRPTAEQLLMHPWSK